MLEDSDIILFLILTKLACDSSLVPSIDPVCGMDVSNNFYSSEYHDIVLGHGISTI